MQPSSCIFSLSLFALFMTIEAENSDISPPTGSESSSSISSPLVTTIPPWEASNLFTAVSMLLSSTPTLTMLWWSWAMVCAIAPALSPTPFTNPILLPPFFPCLSKTHSLRISLSVSWTAYPFSTLGSIMSCSVIISPGTIPITRIFFPGTAFIFRESNETGPIWTVCIM